MSLNCPFLLSNHVEILLMGIANRLALMVGDRLTTLSDAELRLLQEKLQLQLNIRDARAELRNKRIGELNAAVAQFCADFPEVGVSLDRGVFAFYDKNDPPVIPMLPSPEHYKTPQEKAARKTIWMVHAQHAKDPQQRKAKAYTDKESCLRRVSNLLKTQCARVSVSVIQGTISTFTLEGHSGLGKIR